MIMPFIGNTYLNATTVSRISTNETDPSKTNGVINPGLDPIVTLSTKKVVLFFAANSIAKVNVTSNVAWTVIIDASWLKVINPLPGNGNGIITFQAEANTSNEYKRSANVIIRATGLADQIIEVEQSKKLPAITLKSSASNGSLSVELVSNFNGTFYIDWGDDSPNEVSAIQDNIQQYSTTTYQKDALVKVYSSGITTFSAKQISLTSLDVSDCATLTTLNIYNNNLTDLDVSNNLQLTSLTANYNSISVLDVSRNKLLTYLNCNSNQISALNISENLSLTQLYCSKNQLTQLDVSKNSLTYLECYSNKLDLSSLPQEKPAYNSNYNYAPQAKITPSVIKNVINISSQLNAKDINDNQQITDYKWFTKSTNTALVKDVDYNEINGVFTFLIPREDSVYCSMTNTAFQKLSGINILKTVNFKVPLRLPILTTGPVINPEANSASLTNTITDFGIPDPTTYGICWNTTSGTSPTILDSHTASTDVLSAPGDFSSIMSSLNAATTYYCRAYATNTAGTGYGNLEIFTTKGLLPQINTLPVTNDSITRATGNGNILNLGTPACTEYGIAWSPTPAQPSEQFTKIPHGGIPVTGSFSVDIAGLTAFTTYYVRAYATNTEGTTYGEEEIFKTVNPVITSSYPDIPLAPFSTNVGYASATQTFVVGGTLNKDLTLTASPGFEVREMGIGTFGQSVLFSPGTFEKVQDKIIEIRIASTATLVPITDAKVTCSSIGASDLIILLTGTVNKIPLTVTAVSDTKEYDGSVDSKEVPTLTGTVFPGDVVTLIQVFDTPTAGSNHILIPSVLTIKNGSGDDVSGNYSIQPVNYVTPCTISQKQLKVTGTTINPLKEYNGNTSATVTSPGTLEDFIPGDDVTLATTTATYDNANVGPGKTITVSYALNGLTSGNYIIPVSYDQTDGQIDAKQLKVTGTTINPVKEYNGNTSATVTFPGTLEDFIPGDDVTLASTTATYANAGVGTGKTITVSYALGGLTSGNYLVPVSYEYATPGTINQKELTVTGTLFDTAKDYDGNTSVKVTQPGTLVGIIDNENVRLTSAIAAYSNTIAGDNNTITVKYVISGTDVGNYKIPADLVVDNAKINKKQLTVSGTTINPVKAYDRNTSGIVTMPGILEGFIAGDDVTLASTTATYDNANVGPGKTITVSYALNGSTKDNYLIPVSYEQTDGQIDAKQLKVSGTTINPLKEYNGNTSAAVTSPGTLEDFISGDDVTLASTTATYDNANVGPGKTITVSYALNGSTSGNYLIPASYEQTDGQIDAKQLKVSGTTINPVKEYDGNTSGVVLEPGTLEDFIPGDDVTLASTTATYNIASVGTGKTITVSYSLNGLTKDNYIIPASYDNPTPGTITQKELTVSGTLFLTAKDYDGNASVKVTQPGTLVGIIGTEDVILTSATGVYSNAIAGDTKIITVTYVINGTDVGNYKTPDNLVITNGKINQKQLKVNGTTINPLKEYDGNTSAEVTFSGTLEDFISGDDVTLASTTATYDNANVGPGKTITVSYTLNGLTSGNYIIPVSYDQTDGQIDAKQLKVSGTTINPVKEYNGNTSATVTFPGTLEDFIPGDDVTLASTTATYDNVNVGPDKIITVSYSLNGLTKGNYLIPVSYDITTSGTITQKELTVSGTLFDTAKDYDGSTSVNVTQPGTLEGIIGTEDVNLTSATGVYSNAIAGDTKIITVTYVINGTDIGNYKTPANLVINDAKINQRQLKVTGTTINPLKEYNGNTSGVVNQPGTLEDFISGDDVTLASTTATYDNANVGSGKTITVSYVLNGLTKGNYLIPASYEQTDGKIEAKQLKVTGTTINPLKEYNGNTSAAVTSPGTLEDFIPGDDVTLATTTATYDNANVGPGKTITVSYTLNGLTSGNYLIPASYEQTDGKIDAKQLKVSGTAIKPDKEYDGNTSGEVIEPGTLEDFITGDDVILASTTATYNNASVGTGKTINVSYSLSGLTKDNYIVPASYDIITPGTINQKKLTVSGTLFDTAKDYDGSASVKVTQPGSLVGIIGTEDVILTSAIAAYSNTIAGDTKTITVTYTINGADVGNYKTPASLVTTNGKINQKPLIALGTTFNPVKEYDGNASINVTQLGTLGGVITGENVNMTSTASYDNASVGAGKTITVIYELTGSNSTNYEAPASYMTTGEITSKALSAKNTVLENNKTYDGTTFAIVTPGDLTGILGTDDVKLTATAAYDNINVGTGKTILVSYGLIGAAASNYSVPSNYSIYNGSISKKLINVDSLKFTTSKVYDANATAIFSVGSLSGVLKADSANVILTGTATYDNANAGIGKKISVAFNLKVTTASENYLVPSNYTITNGEIQPKSLTITNPVVVLDKMVDGNTTAVITKIGDLQGLETIDINKVTVTATANYNNPAVGVNKTISVEYTLGGAAMDNYKVPANYTITGAKISDNITLSSTITSTSGCEGSYLDLEYTVLTGTPTQYKITFSNAAINAGILNVNYTDLTTFFSTGTLPVTIPKGTKDGVYQGTLQMRNELGIEGPVYNFQFTINVSSDFIIPKFDDVVLCDNSSNNFVTYQWYKNGSIIDGATKQFYNDPDGLIGSYSLKVTTTDGQTLYTCSKELSIPLIKKISVYPSPAKINQPCTVKMTGLTNEELDGAKMSIYSMQGKIIYHSTKVERQNIINLPAVDGMYIGNVTTSKGEVFPFKVIVAK